MGRSTTANFPPLRDHGLEVIKKSAEPVANPVTNEESEYQLRMRLMNPEDISQGGPLTPTNLNIPIANADEEVEIDLPVNCKRFILKARIACRLRLADAVGETDTNYLSIPFGGYHVEENPLTTSKIYVQSNVANNIIEIRAYT